MIKRRKSRLKYRNKTTPFTCYIQSKLNDKSITTLGKIFSIMKNQIFSSPDKGSEFVNFLKNIVLSCKRYIFLLILGILNHVNAQRILIGQSAANKMRLPLISRFQSNLAVKLECFLFIMSCVEIRRMLDEDCICSVQNGFGDRYYKE